MSISLLKESILLLAKTLRKQDFLVYFKKISLLDQSESSLTLGVASHFIKDNILHKFEDSLLQSIQAIAPQIQTIHLLIDSNIDQAENTQVIDCQLEFKNAAQKTKKEAPIGEILVDGIVSRSINDKYRFDNFIIGPATQLAFAACEAISRKPGTSYSPLYIYGAVGLGKTHLLQATGAAIKQRFRDLKVIYTTADRFTTDYVTGIKNRTVDKMRERYRSIDVLIIDDVQFLAGKASTQEELFNIFNVLFEENKQIILSGDKSPKELTHIEPRLTSRFGCGVTVDVGVPDYETRLAILQEKSRMRNFLLPQDAAEYIAANTGKNVRELEGILNQMIAEYELYGRAPSIEYVRQRLGKLSITENLINPKERKAAINNYQEVIEAVAAHFGIESKKIISEDRKKEHMIPRQVAMYLLKSKLGYTYDRIGNIFSGRNHSAVLYNCRKLETILKKNQQLSYDMSMIKDKLGI